MIRERDIEAKAKRYARQRGDYVRKFVSMSNRSVPDDLLITAGWMWLAEFKAPGKTLTELQAEEHRAIKEAGGLVFTFDNVDEFIAVRDYLASKG
jgi:hypothetical protein